MNRYLIAFLIAVCVALVATGTVAAQAPTPPSAFEPKPPIMQFMVAIIGLALILMILCMPTRKGHSKGD